MTDGYSYTLTSGGEQMIAQYLARIPSRNQVLFTEDRAVAASRVSAGAGTNRERVVRIRGLFS